MALTTAELALPGAPMRPRRSKRRLSRALFALLSSVALLQHSDRDGIPYAETANPLSHKNSAFRLSSDLTLVSGRQTHTETLQAISFEDCRSESVGADVARWTQPCAPVLDQIAWRRVFTWIVGADENLSTVAILEPPVARDGFLSGSYGYEADGVPGYGVLRIIVTEDGAWQICDCWGDAVEANRVDELAGHVAR